MEWVGGEVMVYVFDMVGVEYWICFWFEDLVVVDIYEVMLLVWSVVGTRFIYVWVDSRGLFIDDEELFCCVYGDGLISG